MSILEISAFIRELSIRMEIFMVQESIDPKDRHLCNTYAEWESSRKWLIDLGWNAWYCIN